MTPSWDLLRRSITLVQNHITPAIYLYFMPALIVLLGVLLIGKVEINKASTIVFSGRVVIGLILMVVAGIVQIINLGPLTRFQLDASDGNEKSVSQLYADGLRFSWRLFLYYILYGIMIFVGLLLLIVPGVIIFRRYYLAGFYIVDKDLGVIDALKQCAERTKPYKNYVWGVVGVELAVSVASSFMQIIPMLGVILAQIITATYLFMNALRYREIEPSK